MQTTLPNAIYSTPTSVLIQKLSGVQGSKQCTIRINSNKLFRLARNVGTTLYCKGDKVTFHHSNQPNICSCSQIVNKYHSLICLARKQNIPISAEYKYRFISVNELGKEILKKCPYPRSQKFVKCFDKASSTKIKFKNYRNLEIYAQKNKTDIALTYEFYFSISRQGFCRLIELYSWNSDDEIIAKRILPSINFEPFNELLHGTSLTNPAHYMLGCFKRILPDYPVDKQLYEEFKEFYLQNVRKLEPIKALEFLGHEELDQYWLEGSKYTEKQRKHFHDLVDIYREGDVSKDIYACQSFIKRELYEEEKFARIINSRSDFFKVITAPCVKLIEEEVYVNKLSNHFIKHHQPEWITSRIKSIFDAHGEVCETDYSSFESSFGVQMLELERMFFDHMLQNNPEVKEIVDNCYSRENKLISSNGINVTVKGTRMSGEMWTSLGNGFMNYNLVSFVSYKNNAISDFIVEGDDCLVGYDKEVDYSYVNDLGFRLKLEHGNSINDLSFCGYKVRYDGKPLVDIERSFRGLAYSRRQEILEAKETRKFKFKNYIACLALSYYFRCQYTPFLNTILYKIIKDGNSDLEDCRQYLDWWSFQQAQISFVNLISPPIYDEAFYKYLLDEYGYNKDEYVEIEKQIQHINYSHDIVVDLHRLQ